MTKLIVENSGRKAVTRAKSIADGNVVKNAQAGVDYSATNQGNDSNLPRRQLGEADIVVATVVTCNEGLGTYVVTAPRYEYRMAVDTVSGLSEAGAKESRQHMTGSSVLVVFPKVSPLLGFILGAVPRRHQNIVDGLGDINEPGTPVGLGYDLIHRLLADMDVQNPGLAATSYNNGRSWDSIPGEYSITTPYGTMLVVSPRYAKIAAGLASVAINSVDDAVDIYARYFSLNTPVSERTDFVDGKTGSSVDRWTPYSHEGAGLVQPNSDSPAFDVNTDYEYQYGNDPLPVKLLEELQTGVFRDTVLKGYIADGSIHHYAMDPSTQTELEVNTTDKPAAWRGVTDLSMGHDGLLTLQMARGFVINKTPIIPVPNQVKAPWEETRNQSLEEFSSRGNEESEFEYGDSYDLTSAVLAEYVASRTMRTNTANMRAAGGWNIANPSEVAEVAGVSSSFIPTPLGNKYRAESPESNDIQSDPERPATKVFNSSARVAMTPEGGFIIQDAWGSSISMVNGNIEICPAGDLVIRPGRNMVAKVPNLVSLQAGNSAELVADAGSIRMKAETDVHVLAAAGGVGGLVLQSDSTGEDMAFDGHGDENHGTGVLIKCKDGMLVSETDGVAVISTSDINLLADESSGRCYLSANELTADLGTSAAVCVDKTSVSLTAAVAAVRADNSSYLFMSDGMAVTGNSGGSPSLTVDGTITAVSGISSPIEEIRKIKVSEQTRQRLRTMAKASITAISRCIKAAKQLFTGDDALSLEPVELTFNSSEQYGVGEDFYWLETPWQTFYRAGGHSKTLQPTQLESDESMAWPGAEASQRSGSLKLVDTNAFTSYDWDKQRPKDRQQDGKLGGHPSRVTTDGTLARNYTIDKQGD